MARCIAQTQILARPLPCNVRPAVSRLLFLIFSLALTGCLTVHVDAPVSGATVTIAPLESREEPVIAARTSSSAEMSAVFGAAFWETLPDTTRASLFGHVAIPDDLLIDDALYVVTASGGSIESAMGEDARENGAEIHGLFTGAQLQYTEVFLSPLTDALYRSLESDLAALTPATILSFLDQRSGTLSLAAGQDQLSYDSLIQSREAITFESRAMDEYVNIIEEPLGDESALEEHLQELLEVPDNSALTQVASAILQIARAGNNPVTSTDDVLSIFKKVAAEVDRLATWTVLEPERTSNPATRIRMTLTDGSSATLALRYIQEEARSAGFIARDGGNRAAGDAATFTASTNNGGAGRAVFNMYNNGRAVPDDTRVQQLRALLSADGADVDVVRFSDPDLFYQYSQRYQQLAWFGHGGPQGLELAAFTDQQLYHAIKRRYPSDELVSIDSAFTFSRDAEGNLDFRREYTPLIRPALLEQVGFGPGSGDDSRALFFESCGVFDGDFVGGTIASAAHNAGWPNVLGFSINPYLDTGWLGFADIATGTYQTRVDLFWQRHIAQHKSVLASLMTANDADIDAAPLACAYATIVSGDDVETVDQTECPEIIQRGAWLTDLRLSLSPTTIEAGASSTFTATVVSSYPIFDVELLALASGVSGVALFEESYVDSGDAVLSSDSIVRIGPLEEAFGIAGNYSVQLSVKDPFVPGAIVDIAQRGLTVTAPAETPPPHQPPEDDLPPEAPPIEEPPPEPEDPPGDDVPVIPPVEPPGDPAPVNNAPLLVADQVDTALPRNKTIAIRVCSDVDGYARHQYFVETADGWESALNRSVDLEDTVDVEVAACVAYLEADHDDFNGYNVDIRIVDGVHDLETTLAADKASTRLQFDTRLDEEELDDDASKPEKFDGADGVDFMLTGATESNDPSDGVIGYFEFEAEYDDGREEKVVVDEGEIYREKVPTVAEHDPSGNRVFMYAEYVARRSDSFDAEIWVGAEDNDVFPSTYELRVRRGEKARFVFRDDGGKRIDKPYLVRDVSSGKVAELRANDHRVRIDDYTTALDIDTTTLSDDSYIFWVLVENWKTNERAAFLQLKLIIVD